MQSNEAWKQSTDKIVKLVKLDFLLPQGPWLLGNDASM